MNFEQIKEAKSSVFPKSLADIEKQKTQDTLPTWRDSKKS
jgi:hypothetical protein